MNVMVTGGYGHIGIYLVRQLLEAGDKVVVFDQATSPNHMHYAFNPADWPNLTFVKGDIRDIDQLREAATTHKIEYLAHLVAMLAAESKLDPVKSVQVNCIGLQNSFEVARALSMKRVVWTSSLSVYGPQSAYGDNNPLPNDAPQYPRDLYGICKSFGERLAMIYSKDYGMNIVAIRFTQGYGVGRMRGGGLWTVDLTQNSVTGKPVVIANGDDAHNFVLAEDEADVVFTALKAPVIKSGSYNMNGEVATKKEVAAMVKALAPQANITLSPGKHDPARFFDDSALQAEIGWKPKHTLQEGIRKTVTYAKQKLL